MVVRVVRMSRKVSARRAAPPWPPPGGERPVPGGDGTVSGGPAWVPGAAESAHWLAASSSDLGDGVPPAATGGASARSLRPSGTTGCHPTPWVERWPGGVRPRGRWGVATGGAQGRRPVRSPWRGAAHGFAAPAGRGSSRSLPGASFWTPFLRLCRGGPATHNDFRGWRWLEDALTPPVATALEDRGVHTRGGERVDDAHARAAGVCFRSGAVPEGRHAPLASADQHAASGEGVRHG